MFDNDYICAIEKFLTVCLPVSVKPCVRVGNIKTECCGRPILSSSRAEKCCNKGCEEGSCHFTIIQKMKIEIPLEFTADTDVDNLFVDCELKDDCD